MPLWRVTALGLRISINLVVKEHNAAHCLNVLAAKYYAEWVLL